MSSRRAVGSFVVQAGLLAAPVQLFTSVGENESRTKRRELHTKCNTPLNRRQYCATCETMVTSEEVTKGFEYEKGQFVLMPDDECKNLVVPSKNVFAIEAFVDPVDSIYFDKTYDLSSGKGGEPVFNLLINGLHETGKHAVGKVTLRDKEQLAVLRECRGVLLMHTLYYGNEIRPTFGQALPAVDATMLTQMTQLVQMMAGNFDPNARADAYTEAFLKAVEAKRRDPAALVTAPTATQATPTVDLAEALKTMLASTSVAPKKSKAAKRK